MAGKTKEPAFRNRKASPIMAFYAQGQEKEEAAKPQPAARPAYREEPAEEEKVQAAPVQHGEAPVMLQRPKKAVNDKRVGIYMPNDMYVKLYNESVREDMSLNAYVLKLFREHLGE